MSPDPPPGTGNGLHHGHHHHDLDDHVQRQLHTETQDAFQAGNGDDSSTIAVVDPDTNPTKPENPPSKSTTTGLHSPPDSNNVDGSTDSELSDLDEAIANADDMQLDSPESPAAVAHDADPTPPSATGANAPAPDQPEQAPTPEQDEDIGEVLPDHWSGNVPVFKPNMDQFKDFKKFVCCSAVALEAYVIK